MEPDAPPPIWFGFRSVAIRSSTWPAVQPLLIAGRCLHASSLAPRASQPLSSQLLATHKARSPHKNHASPLIISHTPSLTKLQPSATRSPRATLTAPSYHALRPQVDWDWALARCDCLESDTSRVNHWFTLASKPASCARCTPNGESFSLPPTKKNTGPSHVMGTVGHPVLPWFPTIFWPFCPSRVLSWAAI